MHAETQAATVPRRFAGLVTEPIQRRRLALVSSDDALRRRVAERMGSEGFSVAGFPRGNALSRALYEVAPDVILLDLELAREDAFQLCRRLTDLCEAPLIALSGSDGELDRVLSLELGADAVVSRAASGRELLAQIRARLRRSNPNAPSLRRRCRFDRFEVDLIRRNVRTSDDGEMALTPGDFSLLCAFLERPRVVLTREALLEICRGGDAEISERVVDVQVSRLRRKLASHSGAELIHTRRHLGYVLEADVGFD